MGIPTEQIIENQNSLMEQLTNTIEAQAFAIDRLTQPITSHEPHRDAIYSMPEPILPPGFEYGDKKPKKKRDYTDADRTVMIDIMAEAFWRATGNEDNSDASQDHWSEHSNKQFYINKATLAVDTFIENIDIMGYKS